MHVHEPSERAARASSEVMPNADVRLMVAQVKGIVGVLSNCLLNSCRRSRECTAPTTFRRHEQQLERSDAYNDPTISQSAGEIQTSQELLA